MNWVILWDKLGFSCKELHRWPSKRAKSVFRPTFSRWRSCCGFVLWKVHRFEATQRAAPFPWYPQALQPSPNRGAIYSYPLQFISKNITRSFVYTYICESKFVDVIHILLQRGLQTLSFLNFSHFGNNLKKNIFIEKILLFAITDELCELVQMSKGPSIYV